MSEGWNNWLEAARPWGRHLLFIAVVLAAGGAVGTYLLSNQRTAPPQEHPARQLASDDFQATVARIDAEFRADWEQAGLRPAPLAPDLVLARRIALGLMGTIPSLEEIRAFEAQPAEGRVQWWLSHVLEDRRSAVYLAERLKRAVAGVDNGTLVVYRADLFRGWLSDQLLANRPYDELVRAMITSEGLWTDNPATNFVTATIQPDSDRGPDKEKLAIRTTRAFLGVRLDCVQCHDDNLGGPWRQSDFHQLAAFYGGIEAKLLGVRDSNAPYRYKYLKKTEEETVLPAFPFAKELLKDDKDQHASSREHLAAWVTHKENKAFARAAANRAWALMTGRPLISPIDSVPLEGPYPPGLVPLADDFAAHGYDLRRLFRLIAATEAFTRDSRADFEITEQHEQHWAAFPLIRLRPEQVAGSLLQAAQIHTVDSESNVIVRLIRQGQEQQFVQRYGDAGADEFESRGGTIPQALLRMNGELVRERTEPNLLFNAAATISLTAPTNDKAVEAAFLTVLTRRPTAEELEHFSARLGTSQGEYRGGIMQDMYWTLLNVTEFSWNH